ncbi:MAG TPA: (2Fe-2S)-binding protein [Nocardioidaceae bacterium]|nr:(2Fe-2S)-binding protein [Nocardioidaceae bacterium]
MRRRLAGVSGADHDVADALRKAAEIGPFFALTLDPPGPGWTAFADFAADDDTVAEAVAEARIRLAVGAGVDESAVEWRAAASVWHLGVVARVVSPALGAAALAGWCPRLGGLRWHRDHQRHGDSTSSLLAVRTDELDGTAVVEAAAAADAIAAGVIDPVLGPLTRTVAEVGSVSDHVLWGNVWSASAGAATMIARARPESGPEALAIVRALVEAGGRPMPGRYLSDRYRRDTCCLYYRLPRGGLCGDCVLRRMPSARPARP